MLDFFTSIDDFVWGPPLLVLLVGTGIYLTIRLGLLQIIRLPKAFKLSLLKIKERVIFLVLQPLPQHLLQLLVLVILLVLRQPLRLVGLVLFSGCGLLLSLVWQPNMLKVS